MNTPIIFDLVIIAVLALNLFLGWSKGMVRSLLALAATILAIIAASQIGDIASDVIVERVIRPATHAAIEQRIVELDIGELTNVPLDAIEQAIAAIENDFVRDKAQELLSTVNLPTADMTKDSALSISTEVADTVLRGIVRNILCAVICVLCFVLLSLALRPVIWMVEQAFELPLLKQINQIGGLVSGAVKGILLVLIAAWVLRRTYLTEDIISGSHLLKFCIQCLDSIGSGTASGL